MNSLEIILLSLFSLVWLYQLYFWLRYMLAVWLYDKKVKKGKVVRSTNRPPVTVVVCARNEAYNLDAYLQALLSQDYPEYEVIIVNDESEDDTESIIKKYQRRYDNLRLTFVPRDARVRSSKKLALTLAAKAAKYDYLLLTDADCRPESTEWISEMMSGFTEGKEVVLGFGAYFREHTAINRIIQYDTLFNGLQYLGMAIAGHPYMGVGRNLAYRKDMFFKHKGFYGMLDQKAGDDDLFVNKVSNRGNTAVVVSKQSVTWSVPKHTFKEWMIQKERHLSVSPRYRTSSKLRLLFEPTTRGLFYGLLIVAVVLTCLKILPLTALWVALGAFSLRFLWQIIIFNMSARLFGTKPFGISLILWDIFLPLNNLFLLILHRLRPNKKQSRW